MVGKCLLSYFHPTWKMLIMQNDDELIGVKVLEGFQWMSLLLDHKRELHVSSEKMKKEVKNNLKRDILVLGMQYEQYILACNRDPRRDTLLRRMRHEHHVLGFAAPKYKKYL